MIAWLDMAAAATMAAFVNGVWIGVLLAGIAWAGIRLASGRISLNATTRFSIWLSVFVLCAGLVGWQGSSYLWQEHVPSETAALETASTTVTAIVPASNPAFDSDPFGEVGEAQVEAGQSIAEPEEHSVLVGSVILDDVILDAAAIPAVQVPDRIEFSGLSLLWRIIAFTAWLAVAGVLLLRVIAGWWGIRKLKQNSYAAPERINKIQQQVMSRLENPRAVRVAISDEIQTAAAVGLINPTILLPASMLGALTNVEMEQVLLHETAHLQRLDDWTMLVQRIVTAVLFFHPGIMLMSRLMDRDREFACDDWVVVLTRRPQAYASCLAKLVAQHISRPAPAIVPGFGSKKDELFDRVKTILDKKRTLSFKLARLAYAGILAALVGLLVLMVHVAPVIALPDTELNVTSAYIEPVVAVFEEPVGEEAIVEEGMVIDGDRVVDGDMVEETVSVASKRVMHVEPVEPVNAVSTISIEEDDASGSNVVVLSSTAGVAKRESSATGSEWGNGLNASEALQRLSSFTASSGFFSDTAPNTLPEPEIVAVKAPQMVVNQPANTDSSISSKSMVRLLASARRIPSSGDKAQLLVAAAEKKAFDGVVVDAYLETAKTIQSSGDRARALIALVAHQQLDAKSAASFAHTVATIPSASDKSRVLINSLEAGTIPLHEESVRDAYLDAIESVASSSAYRRVMSAFLNHTNL